MKKNILVEVCAYTVNSAITAQEAGADRVELCDNRQEGGTTPSYGTIKSLKEKLDIPINCMIRPRGGDFLYNSEEIKTMKYDIQLCKDLNVNGVVFGFLKSNGEIDLKITNEMVQIAKPLDVTFHRAFDFCKNPHIAIKQLADIGITNILSSGLKTKATEGKNAISEFVELAGERINIIAGSGVNADNILELIESTGVKQIHLSGLGIVKSKMIYQNSDLNLNDSDESNSFDYFESKYSNIFNLIKKL